MTRINVGIHPARLHNKHLVAEYREIGRIGTMLQKRVEKDIPFDDIPRYFTLGKGHMTFFLDKGLYIHERFDMLKAEMLTRGFQANLTFRNAWFDCQLFNMYKSWIPSKVAVAMIKQRIKERRPK